jgi:hypothetical protein
MTQHFLLSRAAKSLTLAGVMHMTAQEADSLFAKLRWSENDGAPTCPKCGGTAVYKVRRPNRCMFWRCKADNKEFSLTSGTLFASRKLPVRSYLLAVAIFCNEVKVSPLWH